MPFGSPSRSDQAPFIWSFPRTSHEMAPDVPLVMPHPIEFPVAQDAALDRAADLILRAERPLVMLGAAASRPRLADALSQFVRRMRISHSSTRRWARARSPADPI